MSSLARSAVTSNGYIYPLLPLSTKTLMSTESLTGHRAGEGVINLRSYCCTCLGASEGTSGTLSAAVTSNGYVHLPLSTCFCVISLFKGVFF